MKRYLIISIVLLSFFTLGCENNQNFNFDLSIIDDFSDYKIVAEKYDSQITSIPKNLDNKEEFGGIVLEGKQFRLIYNDLFYYDDDYHFFQLECANPKITIKGNKIIGKTADEILALIEINSDVEIQKNESYINYTIWKSKPAPLNLYLKIKNNKVSSFTLGFMI